MDLIQICWGGLGLFTRVSNEHKSLHKKEINYQKGNFNISWHNLL